MLRLCCREKYKMGLHTINNIPERINWQTNSLHVNSKCIHPGGNFPIAMQKEYESKNKYVSDRIRKINQNH